MLSILPQMSGSQESRTAEGDQRHGRVRAVRLFCARVVWDNTTGDGHTTGDIQVDADGNIAVRAKRSGTGDGRRYAITYRATDAAGNSSTANAIVTVPHSQ